MKRFIFSERNGIYIIDLQKTLKHIEYAYNVVRTAVEKGDSVLFVGTKKTSAAGHYRRGRTMWYVLRGRTMARRDVDQFSDDSDKHQET
mgnify:CR=1 FL=1